MREKKIFIAASAYHVILKEVEHPSLDTIAFLDIHICTKNQRGQTSGIVTFLCKYYVVISNTLLGSWISFSCCLL